MAGRKKSRPRSDSTLWAPEAQALGAQVRARRLEREWTLEVAAEHMHLDVKHLQKIEAGKANVTLATLLAIAAAFHEQLTIPLAGLDARSRKRAPKHSGVASQVLLRPTKKSADAPALLKRVGQRLAELRLEQNLTRAQLASAARVSPSVVERIEWGRQKGVSLRLLARLAQCVEAELEALLLEPQRVVRRGRPPRSTRSA